MNIDSLTSSSLRREVLAATSSDDIERMINQHRAQMKPLEEQFFKMRGNKSQKSLHPIEESTELAHSNIKSNVKVTYHNTPKSKPPKHSSSVDKMKVHSYHL